MSNDLIQKNAELGKFLFCKRYTLQPVKNSLFIAEGQNLKRGAVVDVNGVLVGTNSLMPYAVLENDCDTRAKGAFASVFVKGEFNFDKLFFAEGLSNEDIDNIVYSGSGIGLVIKPYNFSSGFAPKSDNKELSYIKQLLTNPLNLPSKTIRCKFTSGYIPAMGTSQSLVDSGNNVWDIKFDDAEGLFSECYSLAQVIGANTSGVTNMSMMFLYCELLEEIAIFDTSSVTDMSGMFYGCTSLTSVPLFDTSSVTNMGARQEYFAIGMFGNCENLTSVPRFDTSSVTDMSGMFYGCTSLTSVPLFDTSSVTNMNNTFNECVAVTGGALALYKQASSKSPQPSHSQTFRNCGKNTATGAAELAQIPESWGGPEI